MLYHVCLCFERTFGILVPLPKGLEHRSVSGARGRGFVPGPRHAKAIGYLCLAPSKVGSAVRVLAKQ